MAEEIIIKTSLDTSKSQSNTKSLKRELKEAETEAQNLGKQFGEFDKRTQAAARRAAELRDKLDDVNDAAKSFTGAGRIEAFTKAASAAAGGVQAATAAMTLFGVENENVGKALVQLQSAMALTQGLQALEDAPRAFKQLTTVITASTVATKVNDVASKMATGAMSAFGVATTGTGVAFHVLKGAIISTGIGALVVAIGMAVNAMIEWMDKTDDAEESQKKLNDEIDKQTESTKRSLDNATLRAKAMKDGIDKEIQLRKLADQQELADLWAKHKKEKTAVEDYNESVRLIYNLQNKDIADIRKKYDDEADKKAKERRDKIRADQEKAYKEEKERLEKGLRLGLEIEKLSIENIVDEQERKRALLQFEFEQDIEQRRRNGELISAYEIERTKKLNNDLAQLQQEESSKRKEREKAVLLEVAKSQDVDAEERIQMLRTAMEQGLINQIEYSEAYKSIIAEQNNAVLGNEKSTFQQRQEALTAMLKARVISEQEYAKAVEEIEKAKAESRQNEVDAVFKAGTAIGNLIGQHTVFGKSVALAQATYDTFAGANKAFKQGGIFGYASAIAIIANGIENVRRISAVKIPAPPGGGGGGGGNSNISMPSISPVITQTAIAQTEPIQTTSVGNQRVFVVESDITNTQRRVDVLQGRGSVG